MTTTTRGAWLAGLSSVGLALSTAPIRAAVPRSAPAATAARSADIGWIGVPLPSTALRRRIGSAVTTSVATPVGWSPDGRLLVSIRGPHSARLFSLDGPGRTPRPLTSVGDLPPEVTEAHSTLWSNRGGSLAFARPATNGQGDEIDLIEKSAPAAARVVVTGDGGFPVPLDWSPTDRRLLIRETQPDGRVRLYVIDLATGERRTIDANPSMRSIVEARFARDRDGVYELAVGDAGLRTLTFVDAGGQRSRVSGPGRDVSRFALSPDGHYLAYVRREGNGDRLRVLDLAAQHEIPEPTPPQAGLIGSLHFDASAKRLAFGYETSDRPRAAYVLDLAHPSLIAWTDPASHADDPVVVPRLEHFPTFDRVDGHSRRIGVYVYEPGTPGPHPVLVLFHAGVHGEFRPRYRPWIRFLVDQLGYAVLAPNLRGSSGAGAEFAALADGRLRGDVMKDVGALLVWLEARPDLDAHRVIVAGRGYGGYVALMAGVYYSPRLRGIIDLDGIADLPTYLDDLPRRLRPPMRAAFGDERDPDTRAYLRMLSPIALADRITVPVLIVHGRNDRRVAFAQAQTLASLLRVHHVPVWMLVGEHEGHRFVRRGDRIAVDAAYVEFLQRYARDQSRATPTPINKSCRTRVPCKSAAGTRPSA